LRGEEEAGRWELLLVGPTNKRGTTAQALLGLGGAFGSRLFTGPLGALNGSVSSTTSGMSGKLTLGID